MSLHKKQQSVWKLFIQLLAQQPLTLTTFNINSL